MEKFLWDEEAGLWSDWDLATGGHSPEFYASSLFPLLWGCGPVNTSRHKLALQTLQSRGVLDCAGIPTSLKSGSGQQWDYPNVWAPLIWVPVMAWSNSTDSELSGAAESIAESWLNSVYSAWVDYNNTMFEKVYSTRHTCIFLHAVLSIVNVLLLSPFSTTVAVVRGLEENTRSRPDSVGPTVWPFSS